MLSAGLQNFRTENPPELAGRHTFTRDSLHGFFSGFSVGVASEVWAVSHCRSFTSRRSPSVGVVRRDQPSKDSGRGFMVGTVITRITALPPPRLSPRTRRGVSELTPRRYRGTRAPNSPFFPVPPLSLAFLSRSPNRSQAAVLAYLGREDRRRVYCARLSAYASISRAPWRLKRRWVNLQKGGRYWGALWLYLASLCFVSKHGRAALLSLETRTDA